MKLDLLFTRREMVEQALRAAALPGAASFLASFSPAQEHAHQNVAPAESPLLNNYAPKFFSPDDFRALQAFTEILIPSDDTPGAREAHCAQFIDFVLHASSDSPQVQANWKTAMQTLKEAGFHQASENRRMDIVKEMSRAETDAHSQHAGFTAYQLIKHQTAFAFYTSRSGMIETLDYKGNSYNQTFPACNHPEHQTV